MRNPQKKQPTAPHFGVYTRLRPSKHHGVGVFAIRDINKGTYIFYGDDDDVIWVNKDKLKGVPKDIRKLYEDFCIIKNKGTLYGCPKNFNLLTVAWYLNESKNPNVGCDQEYRFFALREIKKGEELTVDYKTYNEFR